MKQTIYFVYCFFIIAFSTHAQQGAFRFSANTSVKDYQPGTIVYKLKPTATQAPAYGRNQTLSYQQPQVLTEFKAAQPIEKFPHGLLPKTTANDDKLAKNELASNGLQQLSGIYTVLVPLSINLEQAISQLRQDPRVIYAEPVYTNFRALKGKPSTKAVLSPNDPELNNQYYLDKVKAKQAWDVQQGAPSMLIGVVDFGFEIDLTIPAAHGDLTNNFFGAIDVGNVFSSDNNLTYSGTQDAHGTQALGITSATPNNSLNIAGIGYNCKYIAVKASDDTGQLTNPFGGVQTAAANGAKVINMSWGRPGQASRFERDFLTAVVEKYDVVLVAAAGQDIETFTTGTERYWYPASYEGIVLSVTGSNQTDEKMGSVDFNEKVGLIAPGQSIRTLTKGNTVIDAAGTSFSAPIVTGAAALVRVQYPSLNAAQVIARLRATANASMVYDVAANSSYTGKLGSGMVDIHKALTEVNPKFVTLSTHSFKDPLAKAGTNAELVCSFKNQLTATANLQVELSTTSAFVSIHQNTATLGALGTLNTTDNFATPFGLSIAANTPANTKAFFTLTFKDGATTLHTLSFYETLNPTFASGNRMINLTANELKLSINDVGRLGIYDDPGATFNLGLNYKGKIILSEAGLMLGTSNSKVSSRIKTTETNFSITRDDKFTSAQSSIQYLINNDTLQDVTTVYEDITNNTERINIEVQQRTRAWRGTNKNHFIIVEYKLRNVSGAMIGHLYAGIFADWNIGDFQDNSVAWEADSSFGYVHNGSTYAGIKLLTTQNQTPTYRAISNSSAALNISGDFTTSEKFTALSNTDLSTNNTANNADVSHVVGAQLSNLAHNETRTVAFALMVADNLNDLKTVSYNAKKQFLIAKTAPLPNLGNPTVCQGSSISLTPSNGTTFEFYAAPPPGLPLHTGRSLNVNNVSVTDTFYVVNKDSLEASATKQVIVNVVQPTASFTLSQDTIEVNETVGLNDLSTGANQWNWDFGNGQTFNGNAPSAQTYSTAGTYQVKLTTTSAAGCTHSLVKPLVVLDCSGNTDAIVTRTDTLDIGGVNDTLSFKNTNTAVVAYQWDFGNGHTSAEANPLQLFTTVGNYTVNLTTTHSNGCKTISTKNLTVINSFTVGVAERLKKQIKLYPNPSEGMFRLALPALPAKALVRLTNVHGQLLYYQQTQHKGAQTIQVNQPHLPPGVYILQIKWGDDVLTKRVIIHVR
ncbi:S8 family serine peptidase [Microscilla marina]|uniref:PKD domain protein n=1 Tax=Microscilla marina ATCC 23134 TaxID=313606 RepID=A1ZVU5_MICM2|nr:S8 family serine peptidase [Microscilla marina]EAY25522.1 PKD domain protein [Microscilla marina ATCC 23134]